MKPAQIFHQYIWIINTLRAYRKLTLDKVAEAASQRHTATTAIKLLAVNRPARIVGCDNTNIREKNNNTFFICFVI